MTINNVIKQQYFNWLIHMISPTENDAYYYNHIELLKTLYFTNYIPDNYLDKNRYEDGLVFRTRFAEDINADENDVYRYLDEPCSLLEMMVALANRCEDTIMSDPDKGNRTYIWFNEMLSSLDVINQTNNIFNLDYVEKRIDIFLNKQYDSNGHGGLFTVTETSIDMRTKDIWYQMQAFLCEYDNHNHNKTIIISSLR